MIPSHNFNHRVGHNNSSSTTTTATGKGFKKTKNSSSKEKSNRASNSLKRKNLSGKSVGSSSKEKLLGINNGKKEIVIQRENIKSPCIYTSKKR